MDHWNILLWNDFEAVCQQNSFLSWYLETKFCWRYVVIIHGLKSKGITDKLIIIQRQSVCQQYHNEIEKLDTTNGI